MITLMMITVRNIRVSYIYFYDTPELELKEDNPTKYWGCSRRYCWGCAREIAIVPSYMYPEIEPCTCWQLDNLIKYKDEHFMNYKIIGNA